MLEVDDECDLKLFDSYEPSMTSKEKTMMWLINMQELKYVMYNQEMRTLEFTLPGMAYLKQHANQMRYYIQKYDMKPHNFGPMASLMNGLIKGMTDAGIFTASEYPILDYHYKLNEVGEPVIDMNEVVFSKKAPDEILT